MKAFDQSSYAEPVKNEIGIVLAGGGTKGAYQIGVWQALAENGIMEHITGFSGSSIGAFNSALMVNGDLDLAKHIWEEASFFDFVNLNDDLILGKIKDGMNMSVAENIAANIKLKSAGKSALLKVAKTSLSTAGQGIDKAGSTIEKLLDPKQWGKRESASVSPNALKYNRNKMRNFSIWFMRNLFGSGYATPDRLKGILEKNFTYNEDRKNSLDVFSTVCKWYVKDDVSGNAEYISWKGLGREKIIELIITSASLPILYPEKCPGSDFVYVDGGYADNEPIKPLYDAGYRKIFIVYLDKYKGSKLKKIIKEQESAFPGCEFLRLIPGKNFDDSFNRSCIITKKMTDSRMSAGYSDCKKIISENL